LKNAYIGYTYQHLIAIYFTSLMDVERKINSVSIEAKVDNKFDDVLLHCDSSEFYFQIKDFDNISLNDFRLENDILKIKGTNHKLSSGTNIIICSDIEIQVNSEIFGFRAMNCDDYLIISASRQEIQDKIEQLYELNGHRISKIEAYVHNSIAKRNLLIKRSDLPTIDIYKTNLLEETIDVGIEHLKLDNLFFIEGKPGIGKSHLVNLIKNQFQNNIIYRFWISNQDKDYRDRLIYRNFINNISKQLFGDLIHRSESEIISEISTREKTLIIDGLDHVENYNLSELNHFISFFDSLKLNCKVVILSRPLKTSLTWEKHVLSNWNLHQTEILLEEFYHINDFSIKRQIFELTNGYPILIKYVGEYFKAKNELPLLNKLTTVDNYYDQILNQEKGKQALSLFLCFKSFVMKSEISSFLSEDLVPVVHEFIEEHPYLFEIRLNRISLFHDSLMTYLRNRNINFEKTLERVNRFVYDSIMSEDFRFLSRFNLFHLDHNFKKEIIKKYSNIQTFKNISRNAIDFESLQAFYSQLRTELQNFSFEDFEIIEYYDLSLITNIVHRDHVSTMNDFYYTYVKALKFNGFSKEDITSSDYLFSMFYYLETHDSTLLFNYKSNNRYSTDHFHSELDSELNSERYFFERQSKPLTFQRINDLLNSENKFEISEILTFVLTNIFVHQTFKLEFHECHISMEEYFHGSAKVGIYKLKNYLLKNGFNDVYAPMILNKVEMNVKALGFLLESNEFLDNNLEELIFANREIGSFDLWPKVLAFIRLSLHQERKIDLNSIGRFWTKYHQRKDYSLLSIPNALFVLEKNGNIDFKSCCQLIQKVQGISEKGYRGLFNEFISLYPTSVIERLQDHFELDELSILWFQLSTEYINVIPERVFADTFIQLIRYNESYKTIDFEEIENVINSIWYSSFKEGIEYFDFKIRIESDHPQIRTLISDGFKIEKTPNKEHKDVSKDSLDHFQKGILNKNDIEFIRAKIKTPMELAGFENGWHATLSETDLFKEFKTNDVKINFKEILYNGILGKVGIHNSFPSLYYFPGNIPRLIDEYNVEIDARKVFMSFKTFLELSLYEIK
jgi:hypothetical protein